MATYQVAYNATTKVATVATDGTGLPSGSSKLGTFHHVNDPLDELGSDVNHVVWQHVRDFLYPLGQWNMQEVGIVAPSLLMAVQKVRVEPEIHRLKVNRKLQLNASVRPLNATNTGVTFASSDTAKATVDGNGLVTGVAAGNVVITVTSAEGAKTTKSYLAVVEG